VRPAAPIAAVLALAASFSAAADTIVLKNGQRILATDVTEDARHVTYQTPAGQLSIPKSIVDRIEHDDFSFPSSVHAASSEPAPVSEPTIEPAPGFEDVTRLTIHDQAIDFAYIATLENAARTGDPAAISKVAAAHYAAAQFLIAKGDTTSAADQYRQGLAFAPDNLGLLLNLAVLDLRSSQFTAALDPLEQARRISPDSADVAKLMGWAYYGSNQLDRAVEEWTRAEKLHPEPDVEEALQKAQRDKAEEADYREGETTHFDLKYYGGAAPALARGILDALEDDYNDLESQLDYTPPEQIGVILYTQQSFSDITRAPGWVGALNDGRLRIPVQGLTAVTPDLAHVLKHELTHSFVGQKSHMRAPTWIQEGVAQWMEGRRSNAAAGALVNAASQGLAPHLSQLEGSWMGLSGNSAAMAYAWSLAVVEAMIDQGGVSDISRVLDRMTTSPSPEAAVQEVLHQSYDDLEQQAVVYLKRQYLQ
jgi:hypothetical protein